jgi:hypothetical protein
MKYHPPLNLSCPLDGTHAAWIDYKMTRPLAFLALTDPWKKKELRSIARHASHHGGVG